MRKHNKPNIAMYLVARLLIIVAIIMMAPSASAQIAIAEYYETLCIMDNVTVNDGYAQNLDKEGRLMSLFIKNYWRNHHDVVKIYQEKATSCEILTVKEFVPSSMTPTLLHEFGEGIDGIGHERITAFHITIQAPDGIRVTNAPGTMSAGEQINLQEQLTGTFPAFKGSGYFSYVRSSSDPAVADFVGTTSKLTAKTSGKTTITIKVYAKNRLYSGSYYIGSTSFDVVVTENEPESITITPSELTLGVNETRQLDYTILPSEASQEVTWKSDDPTVATVSTTGKITGKQVGTTTITAKTSNGLTSKCEVTVTQRYLIDGVRYELRESNGYRYLTVIPLSSGKYKGDIVIPQPVSIDGESYYVDFIEENAFKDCTELNSIILPEGLFEIKNYAFSGCTKLTSIRLNKIGSIGESAFEGCTGLNVIQILFGSEDDDIYVYRNSFNMNAFKGCDNLKKVYIDNLNSWVGVNIYGNALGNPLWPAQAELYLNGEKVVNLTVPVPYYSKELPFAIFGQCSSIESVSLDDGIESIGGRIFQHCVNLKHINLPSSLREIQGYAFAWCDNIETVNCFAATPPNMATGWRNDDVSLDFNKYFAFYESSPQKITLHVPKGCLQAYVNAPGWNLFGVIIDDLEPESGINTVVEDSSTGSTNRVYNLQGVLIKDNATQEEIKSLPKGIYIIGGKKILIQ